ncbi:cell division protein FtsA [Acinetobacter johnsonii]|jgi:cell division protein FtsA|uniref:Cell division protein FtsA n=1 Tax=Acinetobacter johnsonii TaxID=40214 RepID=A0A2W5RIS4_ACIJO|nr:cell division protein FtsA [Acinetobacter johnsonii]MDA0775794.1 cell division protein FtsA [Pseudomonadota bacterium]MCU4325103.1 cell division protein FtsA [Acinetobacter johnsonii]MDA1171046.1 cell division protein FtsA [Pseudomonadota bacterium]PZQ88889.1 MAG: cell division protein FtsA [Acinetobacter johnsonii]QQV10402.1 cell division protein FtsA [Acinetobacter johnsonii]
MNEAVPSVVAIDIGTHKVSVLIGKVHAPDNIQVIGMATARNRGMNKGKIVSLDKVITAIKNAVQEAEDMAECRVHSAWVSIPSAELKSFYASGRTPVENTDHTITTSEVVRALELAKASHMTSDHYLVSAVPLGFELDDSTEWVQNPIRMSAHSMIGHYQLMMLPISTMQNLDRALKGANIGVEKLVVSCLATAEASLLKDEKEYGVCLVDIGAGTTNIAVYLDGRLALTHTLQRGGEHVTRDIAAVLQTTTEEAERIKLLYGCVDIKSVKPDHMIQIQGIDGPQTISRIELTEIVIARYEEILGQVRQELERNGAIHGLYHGVVLTGDASQIEGMVTLTRRMLGVSAHLGNPPVQVTADEQNIAALRRSQYATAAGLLMFSQSETQETIVEPEDTEKLSLIKRVGRAWSGLYEKLKSVF